MSRPTIQDRWIGRLEYLVDELGSKLGNWAAVYDDSPTDYDEAIDVIDTVLDGGGSRSEVVQLKALVVEILKDQQANARNLKEANDAAKTEATEVVEELQSQGGHRNPRSLAAVDLDQEPDAPPWRATGSW